MRTIDPHQRHGWLQLSREAIMSGIRGHIRSNVVGYVALFFALTMGTAYASHTGGANTIDSVDIIDGEVKTADVGLDTLTASDLASSSVGSSEIGTSAVGSSEIGSSAVGTSELAANSVTTGDLAAEAPGKVALGGPYVQCDPAAEVSCGALSVNLPASGRVLLQASGNFYGTGSAGDGGFCYLTEGTTQIGGPIMSFGQTSNEHNTSAKTDGFALSALDLNNTAGTHTWNVRCDETFGNIFVTDLMLSATYIR
jgi:hypothetical protein